MVKIGRHFHFQGIRKACAKLKQARIGSILSVGDWGFRERSGDDLLWERGGQLCTWKMCVWEASLDHAARDQEMLTWQEMEESPGI